MNKLSFALILSLTGALFAVASADQVANVAAAGGKTGQAEGFTYAQLDRCVEACSVWGSGSGGFGFGRRRRSGNGRGCAIHKFTILKQKNEVDPCFGPLKEAAADMQNLLCPAPAIVRESDSGQSTDSATCLQCKQACQAQCTGQTDPRADLKVQIDNCVNNTSKTTQ